MTEAHFAAVGVFVTFTVAVTLLMTVGWLMVSSIKNWLGAKHSLTKNVARLAEAQTALIKTNNSLNDRLKALEKERELRGDEE